MANPWGAHISYGGRVSKISEMMDGVYNTVPNFGGVTPSACKATVYGKRIWALLLPIVSPITGQQTNTLLIWSPVSNRWFLTHQSVNLMYVQHQEINSFINAYGTDGISIYQLFTTPSTAFEKSFQTKLKFPREGYLFNVAASRLWGLMEVNSTNDFDLNISIDNETTGVSIVASPGAIPPTWTSTSPGAVVCSLWNRRGDMVRCSRWCCCAAAGCCCLSRAPCWASRSQRQPRTWRSYLSPSARISGVTRGRKCHCRTPSPR